MALMSLTLDKTIPTVADLLASPLAKYITLAANDCGYSGKAKELIALIPTLLRKSHQFRLIAFSRFEKEGSTIDSNNDKPRG